MANIKVSIINESTVLDDSQVSAAVTDLQTQVHTDFAAAWGVDADLTFVPKGASPARGSWWLAVLDDTDQANALGYHDLTSEGLPEGKVFAGTDLKLKLQWTVTASHELLEMLADPDIDLAAVQSDPSTGNPTRLYAYEVCDACEDDQLGYTVGKTLVSDFVFPSWFESFWSPGGTQFDQRNNIQQAFQILPGGYIGVLDLPSGSGWYTINAEGGPGEYRMRAPVGSRRERRRTPRSHWLKSEPRQKSRKKGQ